MPTTETDERPTDGQRRLTAGQRRTRALGAGLFVALVVVAFLWPESPAGGITICPFRRLTGLSCFGCGMTRGWTALLHGQWVESVSYHPFAPVLFVGLGAWAARSGIEAIRGRRGDSRLERMWTRIEKPVLIGAFIFIVVFGLVRFALEFAGVAQPV